MLQLHRVFSDIITIRFSIETPSVLILFKRQEGGGGGGEQKGLPTSFYPITSRNVEIS